MVDTISYQNLNKFHMSFQYERNQINGILNDYSVQYITRSVSKRVRCENREYSVAVYLPKTQGSGWKLWALNMTNAQIIKR
ncbi:MAG: hypothetical protein ACLTV1_08845 [Christensenellales bacterium]